MTFEGEEVWNWTQRGSITSSAILKSVVLRIPDIQCGEFDYRSVIPSINACTLPIFLCRS